MSIPRSCLSVVFHLNSSDLYGQMQPNQVLVIL